MDYIELVKKLRYESTWRDDYPEDKDMLLQAADAIEDLLQKLSMYEERTKLRYVKNDDGTIEVLFETQWIPVTERLPEEDGVGTTVLCVLEKKKRNWRWVDIRLFMDGDFWHPKGQKGKVTHWMPLPTPPKEKTE